jgi:hypothetical protein
LPQVRQAAEGAFAGGPVGSVFGATQAAGGTNEKTTARMTYQGAFTGAAITGPTGPGVGIGAATGFTNGLYQTNPEWFNDRDPTNPKNATRMSQLGQYTGEATAAYDAGPFGIGYEAYAKGGTNEKTTARMTFQGALQGTGAMASPVGAVFGPADGATVGFAKGLYQTNPNWFNARDPRNPNNARLIGQVARSTGNATAAYYGGPLGIGYAGADALGGTNEKTTARRTYQGAFAGTAMGQTGVGAGVGFAGGVYQTNADWFRARDPSRPSYADYRTGPASSPNSNVAPKASQIAVRKSMRIQHFGPEQYLNQTSDPPNGVN